MSPSVKREPPKCDPRLMTRIREVLERQGVMSLDDFVCVLSSDTYCIESELEKWIRQGKVECLRPVTLPGEEDTNAGGPKTESVYYRWRRDTDQDYLWEQDPLLSCRATSRPETHSAATRRPKSRVARGGFPAPRPALRACLMSLLS